LRSPEILNIRARLAGDEMSAMDQDKDAQKGSPEGDDELENLSSDEKAAFEKIMAEIASATGGAPKLKADDTGQKSKSGTTDKPSSIATPTAAKASSPAENKQANLDASVSGISSQNVEKNRGTSGASDNKNAPDAPSDDPTKDQQAALDSIMAEIGSKRKADVAPASGKETSDKADEPMSPDQQAALDSIMAEIGSKRKADVAPASGKETSDKADEPMSPDQQAALDSIMAEIGSKRKADVAPASGKETPDQADEPMNPDQQAALDSIMAEIGSKRKADIEITTKDAPIVQASEPSQEGSQADIEKIMAEIEAKKSHDATGTAGPSESTTEEEALPVKKSGENLTMEEFDDELSSLLSSAQATPAAKSVFKNKVTEPAKIDKVAPATIVKTDTAVELPKANSDKQSEIDSPQTTKEYPILKEVSSEPKSKPPKHKAVHSGRRSKTGEQPRKVAKVTVLVLIFMAICIVGYWAYRHQWRQPTVPVSAAIDPESVAEQVKPAALNPSPDHAAVPQAVTVAPAIAPEPPAVETPMKPSIPAQMQTPAAMLSYAKSSLSSARQQIQTKISDIQQLKSYYGRGIEEETQKIEDALQNGQIPSFDAALADKKIELGMRAIQRRQSYIAKLDTPLAQLRAMSEQLLFLERRAQIYEVLQSGITGLPIEGFKREADETIGRYLQFNTQVSIDQVELQPPTLETIWAQIESGLNQKANLMAQRAPLNRTISAEICMGNFERKYLLSALSTETAQCLVKWDGKDLYLNSLTEMTPDVARILSQWPGEWISLNGLRQLSPESARYLSQWPGNRMSLNGLSEISSEATAYLSQWKGSQLEMVGLQSIGSWENYGTRLYLSEKLRRQLEAQ
jgi:hypothetical protein